MVWMSSNAQVFKDLIHKDLMLMVLTVKNLIHIQHLEVVALGNIKLEL